MANETWNKIKKAVLGNTDTVATSKKKTVTTNKSAKDIATEKGEPYIEVLSLDIDAKNPVHGSFELEWNKFFVDELRQKGFQGETDEDIIDIWFQQICRNIAINEWENSPENPGPSKFVTRTDIGDGKSEIR
jgi:hypothetical protein